MFFILFWVLLFMTDEMTCMKGESGSFRDCIKLEIRVSNTDDIFWPITVAKGIVVESFRTSFYITSAIRTLEVLVARRVRKEFIRLSRAEWVDIRSLLCSRCLFQAHVNVLKYCELQRVNTTITTVGSSKFLCASWSFVVGAWVGLTFLFLTEISAHP